MPNSHVIAIFEQGLRPSMEPTSTYFEFVGTPSWTKKLKSSPDIVIRSQMLLNVETSPRLEVEIENKSLEDIEKLEVVAVIFDSASQPIASSRTFVDDFMSLEAEKIIFTWNQPFPEAVCDPVLPEACPTGPTTIEIVTKAVPRVR